jgi:trigger factor
MPYKITHRANHTVEVEAELDAEAVERERSTIVQAVRRRASVPGFRPGKAPVAAVQARFGDDIRSELEEQLTGRLLREVFDGEDDLHPITHPRLSDVRMDDADGFRFTAEMEVRPHYELADLVDLQLPEVSLDVSEAEVDAELANVAEEHGTWEPVDDEVAVDGFLVEADLHGVMEDSDEEPYTEKDARFVLGDDSVPEQINEALQGTRPGEQRVAERRFDDDDPNEGRAGKTVRYTIDVKGLKRKQIPDVDDELAKTIGLDSLDELRERIGEVLERNKRAQRRETWRRHLLDRLAEGADVNDLPSSLVQSAVREDLNRFAYSMAMQGVAPDSDQVDWQELSAKLEPGARKRVLDGLILEQLADEWELPVPESEVDAVVAAEARRLGVPAAEHKANLAKEDKLAELRHSAKISATIDEMIRRAGGEVD